MRRRAPRIMCGLAVACDDMNEAALLVPLSRLRREEPGIMPQGTTARGLEIQQIFIDVVLLAPYLHVLVEVSGVVG